MRLKCIGGEHDGEYFDVYEHLKVNDLFRIPEKQKLATLQNFSISPSDISIKYVIYKISIFNFTKDDYYKFLIPEGWTNKQAVMYQFNK